MSRFYRGGGHHDDALQLKECRQQKYARGTARPSRTGGLCEANHYGAHSAVRLVTAEPVAVVGTVEVPAFFADVAADRRAKLAAVGAVVFGKIVKE